MEPVRPERIRTPSVCACLTDRAEQTHGQARVKDGDERADLIACSVRMWKLSPGQTDPQNVSCTVMLRRFISVLGIEKL